MGYTNLEITIVTIERGWKLSTLLTKYSIGSGNYAFSVTSPKDMVDKVIAKSKEVNDLVQRLNIVGHGNAKGIQIGGHFVENSNLKDYDADLRRLPSVMSGESYIHLMGCVVGQDESFLVGLAKATGVV